MDIITKEYKGIFLFILSCFFVSVMVGLVRQLSTTGLHFTQILMMRSFFALLLMSPLIIKSNGKILQTNNLKLHFLRSSTGFIAVLSWFYVVTQIPLPQAVSITFTVPIITTLAAVMILNESVNVRLYLSLFLGFCGVLIIIRPGFNDLHFAHFVSLLSTIIWAISNVFTKKLSKTEGANTITIYLSIIILFLSIPITLPNFQNMNLEQLTWLFFLGLSSNLVHITLSSSFKIADLSLLQPFDFSRLIFTSLIAYFAFSELIDFYTIIGSIVIIFAAFYANIKRGQ